MGNVIEKIKEEVKKDTCGILKVKKSSPSSLLLTYGVCEFNILIQITAITNEQAEAVVFVNKYKNVSLGKDCGYNQTTFTCDNEARDITKWAIKFTSNLGSISDTIYNLNCVLESLATGDKKILFKILKDKYGKDIREN